MGRKRKIEAKQTTAQKSSPVEVVIEDVTSHPICMHGPTLLFSSEKGRYFACASCRDKKECTVHIDEEDWAKEGVKKRNEKYYNLIPKIDKAAAWKHLNEIKSKHYTDRAYCSTCEELYLLSSNKKHGKEHRVTPGLTDEQLAAPSSWLPPLENDAVEAQYMFTKKTVGTILNILKNNNISNIVCIGAPSVHEAAQATPELDSILLDFDKRHHKFQAPDKFIWYNMFNNYMFDGNQDERVLDKFFKKSKSGGVCIVMDPPFGGRVEPLVHTLRQLTAARRRACGGGDGDGDGDDGRLPVLWAFPYFSEPYITGAMPHVIMHDFQVEYVNHKRFSGAAGRSPVRLFTDLPARSVDLSGTDRYRWCAPCGRWVARDNAHCALCAACPTRSGATYRHCARCRRCVKPTYTHCDRCDRCALQKGHVCGLVVESQSCFNCREKGHKRAQCPELQHHSKKMRRKHA